MRAHSWAGIQECDMHRLNLALGMRVRLREHADILMLIDMRAHSQAGRIRTAHAHVSARAHFGHARSCRCRSSCGDPERERADIARRQACIICGCADRCTHWHRVLLYHAWPRVFPSHYRTWLQHYDRNAPLLGT